MIDYKELRVGNWVMMSERTDRVKCNAKPIQLTNVSKEGYNLQHPVSLLMYDWKWFESIPLTPEILEKCGFSFRHSSFLSKVFYIGKNPITHDWLFSLIWIDDFQYPFYLNGRHEIHSLHQLQNLYHALTGEELTYTP